MVSGQNGQRCIVLQPSEEQGTAFGILDFNLYRIRRAQTISSSPAILHDEDSLLYSAASLPGEFVYNTAHAFHAGLLGVDVRVSLYPSVVFANRPK